MPLVKLFKFPGSLGEIKCDLMLNSTNILYFIFYFYVKIKLINVNQKALLIKTNMHNAATTSMACTNHGGKYDVYIVTVESKPCIFNICRKGIFDSTRNSKQLMYFE